MATKLVRRLRPRIRGLTLPALRLPDLRALWVKERSRPRLVRTSAFFGLGVVGTAFAPFYPWWAIAFLAFVVAAIAWRFPLLSLIVLGLLTASAASYQQLEFGLLFLVFALIVSIASLFDWRFGFLVYASVFLARLGLPFVPPIAAALLFSSFLAVAVTAVAGVFLTFLVTVGNLTTAGFFVGPPHVSSFVVFLRDAKPDFTPGDIGGQLLALGQANPDVIGTVISLNFGASLVPFLEVAAWCGAVALAAYLARNRDSVRGWLAVSVAVSAVLAGTFLLASAALGIPPDGAALLALPAVFGLVAGTAAGGFLAKEAFREYFMGQVATLVGRRIADLPEARKVSFTGVGGLEDVKSDLKESIMVPLLKPEVARDYGIAPPRGILLFGPPGCGKTLLMSALAGELSVEMFTVKCSDVMSKWYGESEQKIDQLFQTAKERRPAIIFLDDIDAIAKSRDLYAGDDVTPRLLGMILSEIDGMDKTPGLIIVGTTNRPELVDAALLRPGRFDKIIYVPQPSTPERVEILRVHLRSRPVADDVDLDEIARRTERFSGADLANLVTEASVVAMRRALSSGRHSPIARDDILRVLQNVKASISLAQAEEYERLRLVYERKMYHVEREAGAEIGWPDVRGLERVRHALHGYVDLVFSRPEELQRFRLRAAKGVLLFGPPGCGKSHLMRATANELGIPIQTVEGPSLLSAGSEGVGELKGIFYVARENAPSIVLFDDIDLVANVHERSTETRNLLSQFLSQMDTVGPSERVLVVATTNKPHVLDPTLLRPGRFDKVFYVPPPDREARRILLASRLEDVATEGAIDEALDELARSAEGFSSADLIAAIDEAKLMAVRGGERFVRPEHLREAFGRIRPSVTPEMIAWSREFIKANNVIL